ncbi:hypothetical protein RQCS_14580 [Rhodococcus qingshengii]|uniref:hypothetical protein n=1 Tax=Rhodococcus qingshengii TaxID=334542 RepID=UPI0007E5542E|nr:hypothetical protein [Rhodococcus qingshengii]BCF81913.1 hypothetical protein RQCS_14580 [Rhodococcus qingshengii]
MTSPITTAVEAGVFDHSMASVAGRFAETAARVATAAVHISRIRLPSPSTRAQITVITSAKSSRGTAAVTVVISNHQFAATPKRVSTAAIVTGRTAIRSLGWSLSKSWNQNAATQAAAKASASSVAPNTGG